jgi:hypothetical protein
MAVPPPKAAPRRHRARLWVALTGGIMALLCLGGAGVFVTLYDNATKIKRSAPDAVVDSFLRAYLVDRDDKEASLYECKSGGDLQKIAAFRSDIQSREKQYSASIGASWTSLQIANDAGKTTVSTDIIRSVNNGAERTFDRWQFQVVDQDGWRVCGATPVS